MTTLRSGKVLAPRPPPDSVKKSERRLLRAKEGERSTLKREKNRYVSRYDDAATWKRRVAAIESAERTPAYLMAKPWTRPKAAMATQDTLAAEKAHARRWGVYGHIGGHRLKSDWPPTKYGWDKRFVRVQVCRDRFRR
jgi:hypothetical protein